MLVEVLLSLSLYIAFVEPRTLPLAGVSIVEPAIREGNLGLEAKLFQRNHSIQR